MTDQTNILVVCTEMFSHKGGIQRFNNYLIASLQTIFRSCRVCIHILSLVDRRNVSINNFGENIYFQAFQGNKLEFIIGILRKLFLKPRLAIYSHLNFSYLICIHRLIAPKSKIILVVYGYEAWDKLTPIQLWCIDRADLILSISHFTKNQLLIHNPIKREKVKVVHLALDPAWVSNNNKISSTQDEDVRKNIPYILTVSRLSTYESSYKGIDTLIKLMAFFRDMEQFKDWILIVVGEGDDLCRLENLAIKYNIKNRVLFKGRVSEEKLYCLYSGCDIFALPSKGEGFGLVYLEAMSYSKPVIAGDQGACSEIVIDGETGYLVRHGDIEQLSNKLSLLMRTPELRIKLGENGRKRVDEYFKFPHFVERLEKVIKPFLE